MARLYIRHDPTDIKCDPGSHWGGAGETQRQQAFFVNAAEVSEIDVVYLCVVHEGNCWAVREKSFFSSGTRAGLICVPFNEDPSGKLMLLKDALLN